MSFKPITVNPRKDKWNFVYLYLVNYNDDFINFKTIDINDEDRILIRFNFSYNKNQFRITSFEAINLESDRNVTTLINIKNMYNVLEEFIEDMMNTDKESTNFRRLF